MAELAEVQPVKKAGFVSQRKTKNQERIEKDQKELDELVAQNKEQEEAAEKEAVKEEVKEEEILTKEEGSFKKRYGDIRRHMATKEKEWQSRIEALESQLDKATKNELVLPKSDEEIGEWTKKYPDVAAIVNTIADKKASEKAKELDERVKQIEEMRYTATRDKAEAELMALHPDFAKIREDDDFHDWAEAQPKWVQDALYENADDAKSTARVIDLYKSDKGITGKKSSTKDKSAATEINTRSKTTPVIDETKGQWRESQVDKMSDREYEKNAESIMESIRTGKFIYDISGAAR
tara:strand:- start:169 stop:1050 length:882 start_codon:yes stop_codon:yes gene_type:complete